jgi:hypothetical protein
VFVAGSARSGTTWLANLINHDNRYRYIFEPFRPQRLPFTEPFWPRRYVPPGRDEPELLAIAARVLSGKIRNSSVDRFNRRLAARRRLIKDIWSNIRLGWLHRHFANTPIILLLRHPCAVVSSQMALEAGPSSNWKWFIDIPGLLAQREFRQDVQIPVTRAMERATTRFDQHVLLWCMETMLPLRQLRRGKVHVMSYEHLCIRPQQELSRLAGFLGIPFSPSMESALDRPSQTARPPTPDAPIGRRIDSWQVSLSEEQIRRAMDIVKILGLDHLYSENPIPLVNDLCELLPEA